MSAINTGAFHNIILIKQCVHRPGFFRYDAIFVQHEIWRTMSCRA